MDSSSACSTAPNAQPFRSTSVLFFSALVLVAVLPLFASQTMLEGLAVTFGLHSWAPLVTATTMLGYSAGLFLVVPLLDRIPSRSLIGRTLLAQVACLLAAAAAPTVWALLAASFAVGTATSVVQMIVPSAASLAAPSKRGSVVGNVMSALTIGILLSRPLAAAIAGRFGWRMFYVTDAGLVSIAALLVVPRLPNLVPAARPDYSKLVASLTTLVAREPILRRRALQQGLLMAGFSAFWGGIAAFLADAPFALSPNQLALFALSGSAGVFAAPIAGRAGDRGLNGFATCFAHAVAIAAALLVVFAINVNASSAIRLGLLALAAFLLDAGVVADQALGRREINLLREATRGRANGLYTGIFFIGSALGAAIAGPVTARVGSVSLGVLPCVFFVAAASIHLSCRRCGKTSAESLAR